MKISRELKQAGTQNADAAGILFLCNGRVLVLKRAPHLEDPELWSIPGGVLRPYERPWQGARRETIEECGKLPPNCPAPRYRYLWENPESENVYLTFIVELPPTAIESWPIRLNEEHTAYQWAGPEDLKEKYVHPGLARVLSDDAFDHPRKRTTTDTHFTIQAGFRQEVLKVSQRLRIAGLVDDALKDLQYAGLLDEDSDYGGELGNAVLDLVKTFASQGHSGASAEYALALFNQLIKRKPLTARFWDEKAQELKALSAEHGLANCPDFILQCLGPALLISKLFPQRVWVF